MHSKTNSEAAILWFTLPIAILLAIASGGGVFIQGLYRDNPYFVAQAIGQDLVTFAIVLPIFIVTGLLASRGSLRARLIWLGVLVYLIYTYTMFGFVVRFNPLFLVYVALLGCSVYALIVGLATSNMEEIRAGFHEKTPVKIVSVYFGVLAILFYSLWLSEVVPALMSGEIPQSIIDNGTPTNAVHVLDMAWILPAFVITAVTLWRKQALGYTLAGALLTNCFLLVLAIISMVVFMVRDGQPIIVPQLVIFGVLLVIGFGMLVLYLCSLRSSASI